MTRTTTPAEVQAERDQATQDYNEEMRAIRERTAKLRAERLAREANPELAPAAAPPVKAAKLATKKATPAAPAKKAAKKKAKV